MAEGVLSNLIAKALEKLAKLSFQNAEAWWGARDELKKLEQTLEVVKARVHDAENRPEKEIKVWVRRLKQVLSRADDLADDVLTADRKRQRRMAEGNKAKKVCSIFSSSGPLLLNWSLAQKIKSIRQDLDAINSDMAGLNLVALNTRGESQLPLDTSSSDVRESDSFLKPHIIGRENDKNTIVEMLIDPKYGEDHGTVIPIVGLGGLGKTTLAQLVFNDDRVEKHFDMRKWACVHEVKRPKEVLGKIFTSFTSESYSGLSLDAIKLGIRNSVDGKRFLLVLDDIWDTNLDMWVEILSLLELGSCGSRVIVTTRLDEVASIVGMNPEPYKLGLVG